LGHCCEDSPLDAIAERLSQRLEQKLIERQQRAALPDRPASIVADKCARCHTPNAKAVKESEAPTFFNELGELVATSEQRASMKTAAKLGAMPPPPAKELSDDDYIELRRELERGMEPHRAPPPPVEELPNQETR
jgi:mono/diheme cytochrome c family protein